MNDSKNSGKGLLVLKSELSLNQEQIEGLTRQIEPLAERLGLEPVVVPYGFDIEVKTGNEALLERVCVALEKIAAQGEPPVVSSQEEAAQALNARPSGLNSREVVCKGSWQLGTACGKCYRCATTKGAWLRGL